MIHNISRTRPPITRRCRWAVTLVAAVSLIAAASGCSRHDDPGALWYRHAGSLCPQISSSMLAAISEQESRGADRTSPAGAAGPMQLTAAAFARYGSDDDGNGRASAHDVGDAVMAAGRLMCTDAATIDAALARGVVRAPADGGVRKLYAEAYNAGVTAIMAAGGEPSGGLYDTLTRPYGSAVLGSMREFDQQGTW